MPEKKNPRKDNGNHERREQPWTLRDKILMMFGLGLIAASFVVTEIFRGPFHFEFLIAGLALCGITVVQWGSRG